MWYKEVNGVKVYATNRITINDMVIFNPSADQLKSAGFVEEVKLEKTEAELLNEEKESKLLDIDVYDQSNEVNQFFLNGIPLWLDRETRVGLMHSTARLKYLGKTDTTLWVMGQKVTLNCDIVIGILSKLEEYALSCFDTTEEHKANVKALTNIQEVRTYDYRVNYPEKLNFKT